jgi:hypothetical protein
VSGNAHDEEFLLISQLSIVFRKFSEDSQSILIPNKAKPKMFGDSEPKTSQLCLAMFIFMTPSVLKFFLKDSWCFSKSYNPKVDKIKNVWRLWNHSWLAVSGNVHNEEFLLIFQFSNFFRKSSEVSRSLGFHWNKFLWFKFVGKPLLRMRNPSKSLEKSVWN